jgi:CBS domain-containing protein
MLRFEDLRTISPNTDLFEALKIMDLASVNQRPVVEESRLLGILDRERLLSVLRNQMEVGH